MSSNGRLNPSELAAIPGGQLRKDAAAAWNAMYAYSMVLFHTPLQIVSSYRPYAKQVQLYNLYQSGRGNLAAVPGTSNHGMGLAVDLASMQVRSIIDRIGARFGFSKKWSDAPTEWWHIVYKPGIYKPPATPRKLKRGDSGPAVRELQRLLAHKNLANAGDRGYFNRFTQQAVMRFQNKHGLKVDGIVGPDTWRLLTK